MPTSNRPTPGGSEIPGGSATQLQYNAGSSFGGITGSSWDPTPGRLDLLTGGTDSKILSIGDATNVATAAGTLGQVVMIGNGIAATSSVGNIDQVFQMGASLILNLTSALSTPDILMLGEHSTVLDTGGRQAYGVLINGGGADVTVEGGRYWAVLQMGTSESAIDFFEESLAIGTGFTVGATSGTGQYLIGNVVETTDVSDVFAFGKNLAISHDSAMTLGFNVDSQTNNSVNIGVSATPEIVITAGATTLTGFLQGTEQVAPSAPAANGFRIYAVDNGGKTELLVLFNSGAAQRIAIQP